MAKLTELYVNIVAKTDKLKQGLNSAETQVGAFGRTVNNIGGLIAGAFAVSKISAFVGETIKLESEAEGVAAAFERIANPGLLNELRKSTKGTVSDLELMKAAVQANNFQIPLQQLGSLLEFANKRAQDTGQSVDYLVNSIVMGIGRKSPLILDNLGISATKLREKLKGVGTETASVATMAKVVADIANEEMAKSGGIIETSAIKMQQFNAEWKNLKEIIGKIVMPAVTGFISAMNKAVTGWQNMLDPSKFVGESVADEINRISQSLNGLSQDDALKVLQREMQSVKNVSENLSKQKFFIFSPKKKEAGQQLEIYAKTDGWLKSIFYDTEALSKLTNPPVLGGEGAAAEVETQEERLRRLNEEYTRLLDIQSRFRTMNTPGMSRTEIKPLPEPKPSALSEVKPFEGSDNMTPDIEAFEKAADAIEERNKKIKESFEYSKYAAKEFADSLLLVGQQAESFEDFAKAAVNAAKQFIAAKLGEVVAMQVQNAVKSSGGNPYVALIAGAAVGGATAAMFNSIVPKLAQGGMTTGPTLAMVGDNPSGKELIIPLEKLGKNQQKMPELALRGRDLYWMYKNETDFRNKVI